jgi:DNA-binding LacI/PurR family transcriptional regulator
MGCQAARLLIQAIENPAHGREMLRLRVELVPRGSTARYLV